MGRGRRIPSRDGVVYVHVSVQHRIDEYKKRSIEDKNKEEYKPCAENWDAISGSTVQWVT